MKVENLLDVQRLNSTLMQISWLNGSAFFQYDESDTRLANKLFKKRLSLKLV